MVHSKFSLIMALIDVAMWYLVIGGIKLSRRVRNIVRWVNFGVLLVVVAAATFVLIRCGLLKGVIRVYRRIVINFLLCTLATSYIRRDRTV
jgi:ribose/xylose/arabinose/galactoside ABC-type transport system permease subunit